MIYKIGSDLRRQGFHMSRASKHATSTHSVVNAGFRGKKKERNLAASVHFS